MRTDKSALINSSHALGQTGAMRVLVVEDQAAMADALQRGLRSEGFEVDVSSDGLDGLWRAREFPYDILLLDIMLPGMNGYEICRTLRKEGARVPILMLTAKDGEYDIAEGLELGADDYLTKPFSFVELVARVRALVRRTNPDPLEDTITVGPVSIDTLRKRTTVDNQTLELTAREYLLLEALMRRAGMPLTRGELLDLVWGGDHDGTSNVVDVYVGYVRRKLASATDIELLETVRGVGYRIAEVK